MNLEYLLPYFVTTDIPEAYQPVVDMIGIDAFLKLCQYCMGDEMYFPMVDTVFRKTRNRLIQKEYDGYNSKALAKKYGLTLKQIRNIVNGLNREKHG